MSFCSFVLELRTGGDQSLASRIVLILDKVLDEAACQVFGLLFPLCGIGVGVARVKDASVNALKLCGNDEVEVRNHLGRSLVDAVVEDGVDDAAGVANRDALAGAVPAGVDEVVQRVVDETLPALVELRRKGVVGHVGITDLQPENLRWVVEHTDEGVVESILNFCHYSLNDTLLTDYLDFFEQHGVGVINASPLSMGLLSTRGTPDWHPAPAALKESCARAAAYCHGQGYPIEKLAVQFSTRTMNPRIATTLFSSANPANVVRNIGFADEPMDEQLVHDVQQIIGDQMGVRWKNS